jgi:acyl carrier protein
MNIDEVRALVLREVSRSLRNEQALDSDTVLMGNSGVLDSIILIELCVGLEDRSSELGFEFDWTSDSAMSRSRSMFATVESLAQEFYTQMLASE